MTPRIRNTSSARLKARIVWSNISLGEREGQRGDEGIVRVLDAVSGPGRGVPGPSTWTWRRGGPPRCNVDDDAGAFHAGGRPIASIMRQKPGPLLGGIGLGPAARTASTTDTQRRDLPSLRLQAKAVDQGAAAPSHSGSRWPAVMG